MLIKQGEPRDAFFIIVQKDRSAARRGATHHRCEVGPPVRAALL